MRIRFIICLAAFTAVALVFPLTSLLTFAEEPGAQVNEIERMKAKYGVDHSIADLTPTVCALAQVRTPKTATANQIDSVVKSARDALEKRPVQKLFIYCGDCFGDVLMQNYPDDFKGFLKEANERVLCTNVMTTVTPVCFATIFCGAGPEVHGIKVYEKPVVKVETLFDVLLEAGKKIAIVSQKGNSVITIFRERDIDYYDFPTDKEAYEKSLELLEKSDYDVIVVHDCEYDTIMHKYGVVGQEADDARHAVIDRWLNVVDATDTYWNDYDRLVVFCTDHGSHMPPGAKGGSHGSDIREDAVVNHFYRWRAKGQVAAH